MFVKYATIAVLAAIWLTGCSSIGPKTLPRDRFDYSSAIGESWKYQTLLNIIKLRYMDPPSFIDVAQVVSGYQLQTSVSAAGTASIDPSTVPTVGSFLNFGTQGVYTDRPTITYVPLIGDEYIRGLMTPIRPEQVFSAIQAGWTADGIMFTAVATFNSLRNQQFGTKIQNSADPEFLRVIELMRKLQLSGGLGFRILEGKDKARRSILFFRKVNLSEEESNDIRELKQLLQLNPEAREFQLTFGAAASSDTEIAMQTRSLLQIMGEVAAQADIPLNHVEEGRATPGFIEKTGDRENVRFIHIHSSPEKSEEAYLSIRYRDHWYWIDDRDMNSKRTFAFLMLLFSMAETGKEKPLPLITIPAQ